MTTEESDLENAVCDGCTLRVEFDQLERIYRVSLSENRGEIAVGYGRSETEARGQCALVFRSSFWRPGRRRAE